MNFDENFLKEMGLSGMSADKKQAFLGYLQRELEIHIGQRISKELTDTQLQEFDTISDQNEAAIWLEKNCPSYRTIVENSIADLKSEISKNREKLLA